MQEHLPRVIATVSLLIVSLIYIECEPQPGTGAATVDYGLRWLAGAIAGILAIHRIGR